MAPTGLTRKTYQKQEQQQQQQQQQNDKPPHGEDCACPPADPNPHQNNTLLTPLLPEDDVAGRRMAEQCLSRLLGTRKERMSRGDMVSCVSSSSTTPLPSQRDDTHSLTASPPSSALVCAALAVGDDGTPNTADLFTLGRVLDQKGDACKEGVGWRRRAGAKKRPREDVDDDPMCASAVRKGEGGSDDPLNSVAGTADAGGVDDVQVILSFSEAILRLSLWEERVTRFHEHEGEGILSRDELTTDATEELSSPILHQQETGTPLMNERVPLQRTMRYCHHLARRVLSTHQHISRALEAESQRKRAMLANTRPENSSNVKSSNNNSSSNNKGEIHKGNEKNANRCKPHRAPVQEQPQQQEEGEVMAMAEKMTMTEGARGLEIVSLLTELFTIHFIFSRYHRLLQGDAAQTTLKLLQWCGRVLKVKTAASPPAAKETDMNPKSSPPPASFKENKKNQHRQENDTENGTENDTEEVAKRDIIPAVVALLLRVLGTQVEHFSGLLEENRSCTAWSSPDDPHHHHHHPPPTSMISVASWVSAVQERFTALLDTFPEAEAQRPFGKGVREEQETKNAAVQLARCRDATLSRDMHALCDALALLASTVPVAYESVCRPVLLQMTRSLPTAGISITIPTPSSCCVAKKSSARDNARDRRASGPLSPPSSRLSRDNAEEEREEVDLVPFVAKGHGHHGMRHSIENDRKEEDKGEETERKNEINERKTTTTRKKKNVIACSSMYHARYALPSRHASVKCPFCSTCHLLEVLFNGLTTDCPFLHWPTTLHKVTQHIMSRTDGWRGTPPPASFFSALEKTKRESPRATETSKRASPPSRSRGTKSTAGALLDSSLGGGIDGDADGTPKTMMMMMDPENWLLKLAEWQWSTLQSLPAKTALPRIALPL